MSEILEEQKSEYSPLTDMEKLSLELHKERVVAAETQLQLRRTEMQLLLDRIVKRAEESGKYTVTGLDVEKGVERVAKK